MKQNNERIKPFLKWAGGKTQILEELEKNFPQEMNKFKIKKYIEPFLGSGALFLYIATNLQNYEIEEIIINDINLKLINVYRCLQENVNLVIEILEKLKREYLSYETLEEKEDMFYRIRENFNQNKKRDIFLQSAELIFLNKTCFNGLYRENKKGEFNVPFGKTKNPGFYTKENLLEISQILNLNNLKGEKLVKILNLEYFNLESYIDSSTFVYFDPPYRPITKGGFNDYNKGGFNDENQIELANFCKKINKKNCKFLLSNSDPKNLDENDNFFDILYSSFEVERIYAKRNINSNGNGRGKITELLIKNYKINKEIKMESTFENFLNQLKTTNATLESFTNFEKVDMNVRKVSLKLNQLNYLIGKEDLKKAVDDLYIENKSVFQVLNILIAVRDSKTYILNSDGDFVTISSYLETSEKIYEYIQKTGLEQVFKDKKITNLVDYVFGIEVGLDTNARKNRGGDQMSNLVKKAFETYNIPFKQEVSIKQFPILLGATKDNKVFDFIIEKNNKTYLIEVNFYSSSGSKLNEVARSYINIENYIKGLNTSQYEFVWITDGKGWDKAKNKLEEAFEKINRVYNLTTINDFLNEIK